MSSRAANPPPAPGGPPAGGLGFVADDVGRWTAPKGTITREHRGQRKLANMADDITDTPLPTTVNIVDMGYAGQGGGLKWINLLTGTIWVHASAAIRDQLNNHIMPELRKHPGCSGLQFTKFDLGETLPQLGPISTIRGKDSSGKDTLELHVGVDYSSGLDILLDTGYGVEIGRVVVLGLMIFFRYFGGGGSREWDHDVDSERMRRRSR